MLFEKVIRPMRKENLQFWIAISLSWFLFLGGLYWFCIGLIINRVKRKRTDENVP
jgi:hypothetical protein